MSIWFYLGIGLYTISGSILWRFGAKPGCGSGMILISAVVLGGIISNTIDDTFDALLLIYIFIGLPLLVIPGVMLLRIPEPPAAVPLLGLVDIFYAIGNLFMWGEILDRLKTN